jgi:hypothetical protein
MTTAPSILAKYANDIAFVAEEQPATNLTDFATQLSTASSHMEDAGINNAEDLDTASTYLADAANLSGTDQDVLLKQAADLLKDVSDMVDEYRDMV